MSAEVDCKLGPLHSNLAEIHVLLSGKIESEPDSLNKMPSALQMCIEFCVQSLLYNVSTLNYGL